jgi:hypothetical protein
MCLRTLITAKLSAALPSRMAPIISSSSIVVFFLVRRLAGAVRRGQPIPIPAPTNQHLKQQLVPCQLTF